MNEIIRGPFQFFRDAAKSDSLRFVSYIACLLIPWMLVASRSVADTLCIVISLCFIIHSVRKSNWAWTRDPVVRVALLAWLWMIIVVSPFATDVGESYKVALPWVRWILMYAALSSWVLTTRKDITIAAFNITLLAILLVADTLWQYRFGVSLTGHPAAENYRLTGPFSNAKIGIFLTKMCFPTFGILFYLSLGSARLRNSLAVLFYLGICIATIMLSGERTAFFSAIIGLFVVAIIIAITDRKLRLISLGLSALVLVLSLALLMTQPALQDRLIFLSQQMGNFGQSAYGKLFWAGYQLGMEHWLTGTGFKGFRLLCPEMMNTGVANDCNLHPHNPYIEWFAEAGLIGLLLFISLVGSMVYRAYHSIKTTNGNARVLAIFTLAVLVVHFFPFLGTQSFFSNWPALLLWYSVSIALASLNMVPGRLAK